jgi:prolyl-tRNA synthetase
VATRSAVVVERSSATGDAPVKASVAVDRLPADLTARLERMQTSLLARATTSQHADTRWVSGWDELVEVNAAHGGFLVTGWCGSPTCERDVQAETGATLRVLPFEDELEGHDPPSTCVRCDAPATETAVFARAY